MSAPQFRLKRRLRRLADAVDHMGDAEMNALDEYLDAFRWEAQKRWPRQPRTDRKETTP